MERIGDNPSESRNPSRGRLCCMSAHSNPKSELEVFEWLVAGFVGSLLRAAGQIPADKWNWSFTTTSPTPREICEHTFLWLWCDRQQMLVLDRSQHLPTPPLPADREEMMSLLRSEGEEWRTLIRSLSPEQLDEERDPWPDETRNIRGFLFHMSQHVLPKAGQMWMIHYGLGVDGEPTYSAPHPNDYYQFSGVAPWPSARE